MYHPEGKVCRIQDATLSLLLITVLSIKRGPCEKEYCVIRLMFVSNVGTIYVNICIYVHGKDMQLQIIDGCVCLCVCVSTHMHVHVCEYMSKHEHIHTCLGYGLARTLLW